MKIQSLLLIIVVMVLFIGCSPAELNQLTPSAVSVKPGTPTCPPNSGGFFLGGVSVNSDPAEFGDSKNFGTWGKDVYLICKYRRDTSKKEWNGVIIYEYGLVRVDYQTSGTFKARPDWIREEYCRGTSNTKWGGGLYHQDIFSSSHVLKTIFSVKTSAEEDISSEMKVIADDLIKQIEQAPYAISCS